MNECMVSGLASIGQEPERKLRCCCTASMRLNRDVLQAVQLSTATSFSIAICTGASDADNIDNILIQSSRRIKFLSDESTSGCEESKNGVRLNANLLSTGEQRSEHTFAMFGA